MRYNQDVTLKVGQRWKYRGYFIAEVDSFVNRDNVVLRVVQNFHRSYPIGYVVNHTMDDSFYSLLEGQDRP